MTPLTLLASSRLQHRTRLECVRGLRCVLAARPTGVLHAYVGPLTPSGRSPRAARPACGTRTCVLSEVPLAEVQRRRVCARCTARLTRGIPAGEAGTQSRAELRTAYDGVTAFDLAVDAWRAETPTDLERVEHLALLLIGFPSCKTEPVVSPAGKVTGPLDEHIANARRRLGITRDPMGGLRGAAVENELVARHAAKQRRHEGWRDREDRIGRLGFINATA